jgi:dihydroneopterin aldolase
MDADREGTESSVQVELRGLSIYTHHGVTDAEQEVGQRLEFDLTFDVPHCDAVLTDRVEDTVDYSEVCDIVALAATERSHRTLERVCQVVAERLIERFECEEVRVRAAKPEPPLPYRSRSPCRRCPPGVGRVRLAPTRPGSLVRW